MYRFSGVVAVPGPPLFSASIESKTLRSAFNAKITAATRIGRDIGKTTRRTRLRPLAPSIRADSMISSGISTRPT